MAKLICRGSDIGFTILPYSESDKDSLQDELLENPTDEVLGYVTSSRKFRYTESGTVTEVGNHWSLDILNELPYIEEDGPWIVYTCCPEHTQDAFHKIGGDEVLNIHNWDTWSIEGKEGKIAVVTSFEIF
jgi:hypothetical protein